MLNKANKFPTCTINHVDMFYTFLFGGQNLLYSPKATTDEAFYTGCSLIRVDNNEWYKGSDLFYATGIGGKKGIPKSVNDTGVVSSMVPLLCNRVSAPSGTENKPLGIQSGVNVDSDGIIPANMVNNTRYIGGNDIFINKVEGYCTYCGGNVVGLKESHLIQERSISSKSQNLEANVNNKSCEVLSSHRELDNAPTGQFLAHEVPGNDFSDGTTSLNNSHVSVDKSVDNFGCVVNNDGSSSKTEGYDRPFSSNGGWMIQKQSVLGTTRCSEVNGNDLESSRSDLESSQGDLSSVSAGQFLVHEFLCNDYNGGINSEDASMDNIFHVHLKPNVHVINY